MAFQGNTWYTYLMYSLIAIVAFLGNGLVLYLLTTKSSYLKHSHNVFICSLAITDIITSIMLVFSRYLYLPPMPAGELSRVIYCKTIWSAWLLFTLGYISIYTCLALTIERWLAVVKPNFYRAVKPSLAMKAVVFVWVLGFLTNITTLFRVKYDEKKQQCSWTYLPVGNKELPWLDFTLQSIIPFFSMLILYCHILFTLKKMPFLDIGNGKPLRRITILAFAASCALVIGWLPSRVSFMLSKFGYVDSGGVAHYCLVMFSFANSCVNPFLYGIYSSEFRKEFKVLFKFFKFSASVEPKENSKTKTTSHDAAQATSVC